MVNDGEPIVLTKKMRKALRIKDETENFTKALKQDLKEAGYKMSEIEAMNQEEIDASDEDSVERRKRKAIKEAKKAAGQPIKGDADIPKRISKQEKTRKA